MSAQAPKLRSHAEADYQEAFFNVLRMNEPKPPMDQRRLTRGKNAGRIELVPRLDDPAYLAHALYILTRVRHFPNGGYRHASTAVELRKQGTRPGAFDIFLDAARRGYHGLRIEAKAEGGTLSAHQIEERRWLEREGFAAHVGWHYVELLDILLWYIEVPPSQIRSYPKPYAVNRPARGHDQLCGCGLKLSPAQ